MPERTIRCLYLEDDPSHQGRYSFFVKTAWRNLKLPHFLDVTVAATIEEARNLVKSGEFHLLLIDILFGREGGDVGAGDLTPDGVHFITEVRSMEGIGDRVAVIALSGEGDYFRDATDAGADDFLPKKYLDFRDPKSEKLGETIMKVLLDKGVDLRGAEAVDIAADEDVRSKWILERIGGDSIVALASAILGGGLERVKIRHIRSGLSGAMVARLTCSLLRKESSIPVVRNVLLKVARDKELIIGELRRLDALERFPVRSFVHPIGSQVAEHLGWFGIGLDYVEDAQTADSWLNSAVNPSASAIEASLGTLFLGRGLKEVYGRFVQRSKPRVAFDSLLSSARRSAIMIALEDLAPLALRHDDQGLFNEELVRRVAADGLPDKDCDDELLDVCWCWSHGDLHAKNILVDKSGRMILVDGGSLSELPWPADLARLATDLFVTSLERGPACYEWDKLPHWLEVLGEFIEDRMPRTGGRSRGVEGALGWLRRNLKALHPQVFGKQAEYEFRLALAVELLRSAYRSSDLSGPKRVLGLLGFCYVWNCVLTSRKQI